MKSKSIAYRLLCLMLAISVVMPQTAPVFAASETVTPPVETAMETGNETLAASQTEWLDAANDDNDKQLTEQAGNVELEADAEEQQPGAFADTAPTTEAAGGEESGEQDPERIEFTSEVEVVDPSTFEDVDTALDEKNTADSTQAERQIAAEPVADSEENAVGENPEVTDASAQAVGETTETDGEPEDAAEIVQPVQTTVSNNTAEIDDKESPAEEKETAAYAPAYGMMSLGAGSDLAATFSMPATIRNKVYCYRLGYGVSFTSVDDVPLLNDLNGVFAVEKKSFKGDDYGYRDYASALYGFQPMIVSFGDGEFDNFESFVIFPSALMLGRVPDRQFEGWYLYSSGMKRADNSQVMEDANNAAKNWNYDVDVAKLRPGEGESLTRIEGILPYEEGDLLYNDGYMDVLHKDLGDTWDGGKDYDYGTYYAYNEDGTLVTEEDKWGDIIVQENREVVRGYHTNPVSIVGRWVDSNNTAVSGKDGDFSLKAVVDGVEKSEVKLYTSAVPGSAVAFDPEINEYWVRVDANVTSLNLTFNTEELYFSDYDVVDISGVDGAYYGYYKYSNTGVKEDDLTVETDLTRAAKYYSYFGEDGAVYPNYVIDPAKSHVNVTSTFPGSAPVCYTDGSGAGQFSARMLPAWETKVVSGKGFVVTPGNSLDDPAHSEWTVTGIELQPSAGGSNIYNDIVITVTSIASGERQKTKKYTFHVQRMTEPTLTQFYGNTPVGMIWRDTSATAWGSGAAVEENKEKAIKYFTENLQFDFENKLYPQGSTYNQGGTVYRGVYSDKAWAGGENIDLDPNAIVVYQNSIFKDPGITLTDSEGNVVDITAGNVSRSLCLKKADALSLTALKSGTDYWYGGKDAGGNVIWKSTETWETLKSSGGDDQIDLRGANILPGIYTLNYRYDDPVTQKSYDASGDATTSFVTQDGLDGRPNFTRTVVVLATPGDVDMDGALTSADAAALGDPTHGLGSRAEGGVEKTTLNGTVIDTDPVTALFAYRVCDTGWMTQSEQKAPSLTEADVKELATVPMPQLKNAENASNSDYYYIPLPTGETTTADRPLLPIVAEGTTNVAKLTMEYIGKEQGQLQSNGHMNGISGPEWSLSTTPIQLDDIFWIGVKLTDGDKSIIDKADTFTLRLTYDAEYVEPAIVLERDMWNSFTSDAKRWEGMMRLFNLSTSSQTVWSGSNDNYAFTPATGYGQLFTVQDSQARTKLEADTGATRRTLTFSIQGGGTRLNASGDVWLMAVPFTLIKHPAGQTSADKLVEFQASMSGLTMCGGGVTRAYSVRDSIFGGKTENLKSELFFANMGAAIPLGKDLTKAYIVFNRNTEKNGVYSSSFSAFRGQSEADANDWRTFPLNYNYEGDPIPGLTYNSGSGTLEGIPEKAGTYEFHINNVLYRLTIDPAELHYWADDKSSYYAQYELRGSPGSDYSFSYRTSDICSLDRQRSEDNGIPIDGTGVGLSDVLDDPFYSAPTFYAADKNGAAVTVRTDIGSYPIQYLSSAQSTNYKFIYEERGKLNILARPIRLKQIYGTEENKTVIGTVFDDKGPSILTNLRAQIGGTMAAGTTTFLLELPGDGTYGEGNLPLTPIHDADALETSDGVMLVADSLVISYEAKYDRTDDDKDTGKNGGMVFFLPEGTVRGERDVEVANIRVVGGQGSSNYFLDSIPVKDKVPGGVVGWVVRRNILKLNISQLPPMEYSYGDRLTGTGELHYYILKDGEAREGEYAYNETQVMQFGITVCWAKPTEEERQTNTQPADVKPFKNNQLLTMEYDGYYLCMWVLSANELGQTTQIIQYSEKPLSVKPKTLTLTAIPVRRYYGENNGTLTFTYDPTQLSTLDLGGRSASALKGTAEELAEILGDTAEKVAVRGRQHYTAPKLEAVVSAKDPSAITAADKITSKTKYTGSANAIMIWGASCSTDAGGTGNYVFEYSYTDPTGAVSVRSDYGASIYRIERRLIVVDEITTTRPLSTVYADTKRIYTAGLQLSISEVKLGLPEHTATTTSYYSPGGTKGSQTIGYAAAGTTNVSNSAVVVPGDKISFTYTATMISQDGAEYATYIDFSHGYFRMDDAPASGEKQYPVQVSKLHLEGEDANNYSLVYRRSDLGKEEIPSQYVALQNCIDPDQRNAKRTYYAPKISGTENPGMGIVKLRPVESIVILQPGKLDYQYGNTYSPMGSSSAQTMKVSIRYLNNEINNYAGNTTSEEVAFTVFDYDADGNFRTTFDHRDLNIYWVTAEEIVQGKSKIAEAIQDAERRLDLRSVMMVDYDGTYLVVTGKRGSQDLIISAPTAQKLTVTRRTLTLTAKDINRCYGEENGVISFTFNAAELAPQDQKTLGVYTGSQPDSKLFSLTGYEYTRPTYTTAGPGSNVGTYPITLKDGGEGSMKNYILAYEPGKLTVYPRPIRIKSFQSSKDKPIYTIFSDVAGRIFWTNVTNRAGNTGASFTMELSTNGYPLNGTFLPVTGNAVYKDSTTGVQDELTLRIRVEFPSNLNLKAQSASDPVNVTVTNAELVAGTKNAENYVLEQTGSGSSAAAVIMTKTAVGMVKLRNIETISILTPPTKMTYEYGEVLDLSGLQVTIRYNTDGTTATGQTTNIAYLGTDQFAENGLYVNYYDSDVVKSGEVWANVRTKYRTAATGDHLTVAPTHDSQNTSAEFAADGKYLIITAQRHTAQTASEPQIVCDKVTKLPAAIKVNPRAISFELSAEDKTYDGTAEAAGTMTFLNLYNKGGIMDLVYPVTGADYEQEWNTESKKDNFDNYAAYVAENGYTFSTGTYVPAEEAPCGANKPIAWTPGYDYGAEGTLTFSYLDPNVAYQQEPSGYVYGDLDTKSVQVTGITLGGPDAANYTILGAKVGQQAQVTLDNVSKAAGYTGEGLPEATIHKANRAPMTTDVLPVVEVDPHTNVVRLTYNKEVSDIAGGEEAEYIDEVRFEYALQRLETNEDHEIVGISQLGGLNGQSLWGEELFYGGETAPMTALDVDPAYAPTMDDILDFTADTGKGQIYQWAEEDSHFAPLASAYSNGAVLPGYAFYETDRTALERDALYLPVLRCGETHNYYASPVRSSVAEYTPELIETILSAQEAFAMGTLTEAEYEAVMDEAIRQVNAALGTSVQEEVDAARAETAAFLSGETPDDRTREASAVVKTYSQSIEVVSVNEAGLAEDEAEGGSGHALNKVYILEDIWFTDVEALPSREVLDAVVENSNPRRYYAYAWDKDMRAAAEFNESISLTAPFEVPIPATEEEAEGSIRVNEDRNLRLYANPDDERWANLREFTMSYIDDICDSAQDAEVFLYEGIYYTVLPGNAEHATLTGYTQYPTARIRGMLTESESAGRDAYDSGSYALEMSMAETGIKDQVASFAVDYYGRVKTSKTYRVEVLFADVELERVYVNDNIEIRDQEPNPEPDMEYTVIDGVLTRYFEQLVGAEDGSTDKKELPVELEIQARDSIGNGAVVMVDYGDGEGWRQAEKIWTDIPILDKDAEELLIRIQVVNTADVPGQEEPTEYHADYLLRIVRRESHRSDDTIVEAKSVSITNGNVQGKPGGSVQLWMELDPYNARHQPVIWTSSDPSVATVDSEGRVQFVGVGTATITLTVPSVYYGKPPVKASIRVTVSEVTSVDTNPTKPDPEKPDPEKPDPEKPDPEKPDPEKQDATEPEKPVLPVGIFNTGHIDGFFNIIRTIGPNGEKGVIFRPDEEMTRGEVAMILAKFYIENDSWKRSGPSDFPDLTGREKFADAAKLLGSLGVMVGYPDGGFHGYDKITRAEFVALLARMLDLEMPNTAGQKHAFLDTGEKDTWAYIEIDALSKYPGVLSGVGEGYFAPKRNITRAEAAAFLTRLLHFQLDEDGEIIIPQDVPVSHWARGAVLRVVNGGSWAPEAEAEVSASDEEDRDVPPKADTAENGSEGSGPETA